MYSINDFGLQWSSAEMKFELCFPSTLFSKKINDVFSLFLIQSFETIVSLLLPRAFSVCVYMYIYMIFDLELGD